MTRDTLRQIGKLTGIMLLAASLAPASPWQATQQESPEAILGAALHLEEVEADFAGAIAKYAEVVSHAGATRATAGRALLHIGVCYEKLGDPQAVETYQQVIREFTDRPEVVAEALVRVRSLGIGEGVKLPGQELVSRRIFAFPPRMSSAGAPSPDGRYFSRTDWDSGAVAVVDLASGEMRRLGTGGYPGIAFGSIFSPDGRTIAYGWIGTGEDPWSARLINVDGSGERVLYDPDPGYYGLIQDWSPDGEWILAYVATGDVEGRFVAISIADGSVRVLKEMANMTADLSGDPGASISPDGRWVAHDFNVGPAGHRAISLISMADGSERPLIVGPTNNRTPIWTPDGREVLFVSDRGGSFDLWGQEVVNGSAQGVPRLLRAGIDNVIDITRDGSLYYGVGRTYFDLRSASYDSDTGTFTPQGQNAFVTRTGLNSRPLWAPDGRRLLYYHRPIGSQGAGDRTFIVVDVATGEETELLLSRREFGGAVKPLGWSPDGARVLMYGYGREPNRPALHWLDVASGATELILEGWTIGARLSPDGRTIYIPSLRREGIVALDVATGAERRVGLAVTEDGVSAFGFAVSPDGKTLAYQPAGPGGVAGRGLILVDVASGAARSLGDLPFYWEIAWTPDGRYILGTRGPEDTDGISAGAAEAVVWRIPVDGGAPQPTAITIGSDPSFGGLTFHPDGRTMTYVDGTAGSEVWVLESLLPAAGARR